VGSRVNLDDMTLEFLPPPGLELRPLDRSARSQPLYRLRYPGSSLFGIIHKVKLFPCSITHHTIKTHEVMEVQLHVFLNLALDGGQWPELRLGRFI
jgi:hypothetical protein